MVKFDFSELEKLFAEYVAEKPDDDGGEVYGSYHSQAKDQMDDFLAWLKRVQQNVQWIGPEPGIHKVQCEHCGKITEFEVPKPPNC